MNRYLTDKLPLWFDIQVTVTDTLWPSPIGERPASLKLELQTFCPRTICSDAFILALMHPKVFVSPNIWEVLHKPRFRGPYVVQVIALFTLLHTLSDTSIALVANISTSWIADVCFASMPLDMCSLLPSPASYRGPSRRRQRKSDGYRAYAACDHLRPFGTYALA